ncbi:DNA-binding transcriptional response regulator, NtrC family, contains REC, AAA-type ATPase, and a Fis-type DNA-binding domains [Tenacibaculum sp. MAR_2009_124]|uniref:sigma-54-dependent transcriptional regulator n=1 Tax=Tenacibaculum sp. MAR_2009_124 TaxID=1250059 RepID=UPI000897D540|nr:sigma-54 dependent transcriptional regulator [Tenacibaculum sp. MAR_2009_124]SEB47937.1 DNA-binding transcriptional response regulator, NtrC family, contains REC, AAA-type ATPase, and a Fis-type DNA-binding domains [Tenacibaculum sp. MAR_2009_124]
MRKKEASILIVDDDDDILFSARISLKKYFTEIITSNNPKKIGNHLSNSTIDVVLLDMNYRVGFEDGKEGLYWLKYIKEVSPETTVILMTAFGSVNLAVDAIKQGASDFILKPWNTEKLYGVVNVGVELARSKRKTVQLETVQNQDNLDFHKKAGHIIGNSAPMESAIRLVKKVAPTDANILILGENGTGKYVFAKEIHLESLRKNAPFIHVDLGALNENLFESELFGYAKGAFTDAHKDTIGRFELAKGGTIFLDEIGNLPLHLQSKLLTVIQNRKITRLGEGKEREIDARIICATNAPIHDMVDKQTFRQDLLFRINTIELNLPPLRERQDDILLLANYFLKKLNNKYRKSIQGFSNEAINGLKNYSWPGNIREVEHIVERAVIITDENIIQLYDLHFSGKKIDSSLGNNLNIEETEKLLIKKALQKHQGNISRAAKDLGLTRAALYRRLEKHQL